MGHMPSVTNDALLDMRRSSTYRAGIWLARTANLVLLPVVVWGIASGAPSVPALPDAVFLAAWAVGCVTLAPAMVLFYRSGIPFERRVPPGSPTEVSATQSSGMSSGFVPDAAGATRSIRRTLIGHTHL